MSPFASVVITVLVLLITYSLYAAYQKLLYKLGNAAVFVGGVGILSLKDIRIAALVHRRFAASIASFSLRIRPFWVRGVLPNEKLLQIAITGLRIQLDPDVSGEEPPAKMTAAPLATSTSPSSSPASKHFVQFGMKLFAFACKYIEFGVHDVHAEIILAGGERVEIKVEQYLRLWSSVDAVDHTSLAFQLTTLSAKLFTPQDDLAACFRFALGWNIDILHNLLNPRRVDHVSITVPELDLDLYLLHLSDLHRSMFVRRTQKPQLSAIPPSPMAASSSKKNQEARLVKLWTIIPDQMAFAAATGFRICVKIGLAHESLLCCGPIRFISHRVSNSEHGDGIDACFEVIDMKGKFSDTTSRAGFRQFKMDVQSRLNTSEPRRLADLGCTVMLDEPSFSCGEEAVEWLMIFRESNRIFNTDEKGVQNASTEPSATNILLVDQSPSSTDRVIISASTASAQGLAEASSHHKRRSYPTTLIWPFAWNVSLQVSKGLFTAYKGNRESPLMSSRFHKIGVRCERELEETSAKVELVLVEGAGVVDGPTLAESALAQWRWFEDLHPSANATTPSAPSARRASETNVTFEDDFTFDEQTEKLCDPEVHIWKRCIECSSVTLKMELPLTRGNRHGHVLIEMNGPKVEFSHKFCGFIKFMTKLAPTLKSSLKMNRVATSSAGASTYAAPSTHRPVTPDLTLPGNHANALMLTNFQFDIHFNCRNIAIIASPDWWNHRQMAMMLYVNDAVFTHSADSRVSFHSEYARFVVLPSSVIEAGEEIVCPTVCEDEMNTYLATNGVYMDVQPNSSKKLAFESVMCMWDVPMHVDCVEFGRAVLSFALAIKDELKPPTVAATSSDAVVASVTQPPADVNLLHSPASRRRRTMRSSRGGRARPKSTYAPADGIDEAVDGLSDRSLSVSISDDSTDLSFDGFDDFDHTNSDFDDQISHSDLESEISSLNNSDVGSNHIDDDNEDDGPRAPPGIRGGAVRRNNSGGMVPPPPLRLSGTDGDVESEPEGELEEMAFATSGTMASKTIDITINKLILRVHPSPEIDISWENHEIAISINLVPKIRTPFRLRLRRSSYHVNDIVMADARDFEVKMTHSDVLEESKAKFMPDELAKDTPERSSSTYIFEENSSDVIETYQLPVFGEGKSFKPVNGSSTTWLFDFGSFRLVFEHKFNFGEMMEQMVNAFKAVKFIHDIPSKSAQLVQKLWANVRIRCNLFEFEIGDEPFEVKLGNNYELGLDEQRERELRESLLQERIVKEKYTEAQQRDLMNLLLRQHSQVYIDRCRKVAELRPKRTALLLTTFERLDLTFMSDVDLCGKMQCVQRMCEIDHVSPYPEVDLEYDTLWGRKIVWTADRVQMRLRNFPKLLFDNGDVSIYGTLMAAEVEAPPTAIRENLVYTGPNRSPIVVYRKMPPLKWYHDLVWDSSVFTYNFGPSYDYAMSDVNASADYMSKPSIDPSVPLLFWDKMRLLVHGRLVMKAEKFWYNQLVSKNPYNGNDSLDMGMDDMLIDWTAGMFDVHCTSWDFFIRTVVKQNEVHFTHIPNLRLKFGVEFQSQYNIHDHHLVMPCEPSKKSGDDHDSWAKYRTDSVVYRLHWNSRETEESLVNGDVPFIMLHSSALPWLEQWWHNAFIETTLPIRRGRIWQGFSPPYKKSLGRHISGFVQEYNLPKFQLRYWQSATHQTGFLLRTSHTHLFVNYDITIEPKTNGLISRAKANWDMSNCAVVSSDLLCELQDGGEESQDFMFCDSIKYLLNDSKQHLPHLGSSLVFDSSAVSPVPGTPVRGRFASVSARRPSTNAQSGSNVRDSIGSLTSAFDLSNRVFVHRISVQGLRLTWTLKNRKAIYWLMGRFEEAQWMRNDLAAAALSNVNKVQSDVVEEQNLSMDPSQMLQLLINEVDTKSVVHTDEVTLPHIKKTARYLFTEPGNDVVERRFFIEVSDGQLKLIGEEQKGAAILQLGSVVMQAHTHMPLLRDEEVVVKKSWMGTVKQMAIYISKQHQDVWIHRKDDLIKRGITVVVPSSSCEFSYVSYDDEDITEAQVAQAQRNHAKQKTRSNVGGDHFAVQLDGGTDVQKPIDTFSVNFPTLNMSTDPQEYLIVADIVLNVLLYQEPSEKAAIDRYETIRYTLELTNVEDDREPIAQLQNRVRLFLKRIQQLDFFLHQDRMKDHVPENSSDDELWRIEEEHQNAISWFGRPQARQIEQAPAVRPFRRDLENELRRCKAALQASRQDLHSMIKVFKEKIRRQVLTRSKRGPKPTRIVEIGLDKVDWRLTNPKVGDLAQLKLEGVDFSVHSNHDDSSELRLEMRDCAVMNLIKDSKYVFALSAMMPAHKRVGFDRNIMFRLAIRYKASVGGIQVISHVEINVIPLNLQLTAEFAETMQEFFLPKDDKVKETSSSSSAAANQSTMPAPSMSTFPSQQPIVPRKAAKTMQLQRPQKHASALLTHRSAASFRSETDSDFGLVGGKRSRVGGGRSLGLLSTGSMRNSALSIPDTDASDASFARISSNNSGAVANDTPEEDRLQTDELHRSHSDIASPTSDLDLFMTPPTARRGSLIVSSSTASQLVSASPVTLSRPASYLVNLNEARGSPARFEGRDDRQGVLKKKIDDNVTAMKDRASKTNAFIYVKIPTLQICFSYKGEKDYNLEDCSNFNLILPTLEYHNRTWSWKDLLMQVKADSFNVIVAQVIKEKLKIRKGEDASPTPEPTPSHVGSDRLKETLLFGKKVKAQLKRGVTSINKFVPRPHNDDQETKPSMDAADMPQVAVVYREDSSTHNLTEEDFFMSLRHSRVDESRKDAKSEKDDEHHDDDDDDDDDDDSVDVKL